MTPEERAEACVKVVESWRDGFHSVYVHVTRSMHPEAAWAKVYRGPNAPARAVAAQLRVAFARAIREALEADAAPTLTIERKDGEN